LPRLNEDINEEWISDKARFACDGLKYQRLDRAYVKNADGRLVESTIENAISTIVTKLNDVTGNELAAIAGNLSCCESMFVLKNIMKQLGCDNLTHQHDYQIDISSRGNYLFNTKIINIEKADLCLLIGANPRHVAPILNAKIGKMQRNGKLKVARIGAIDDQTYNIHELGDATHVISSIANGTHEFSNILAAAKYPMIILGDGVYSRADSHAILALVHIIAEKYHIIRDDWNGFNLLHNHASIVGCFDVGFIKSNKNSAIKEILRDTESGLIKFVYLLGCDEIDMSKLGSAFVVYQGHHGDEGANRADVILPSASYTEKDATYVNLEGRAQITNAAVIPPGHAKQDWELLSDLADKLAIDNPAINLIMIRENMRKYSPIFANINHIIPNQCTKFISNTILLDSNIVKIPINYYMTDVISRVSPTMAKCVSAQLKI
jgi:NADH-quinone oxidoreductase subunit G